MEGTTKQFVLHFHEQFRQLDELTPLDEQLCHSVKLTLLQSADRSVPELRIVEPTEEHMSLTNSHSQHYSITYVKYFTMLQNAFIRYDKHLKYKPSSTARAIYQHDFDGKMMMMGTMLMKDLHLMALIIHLMTSTSSTLPFQLESSG